MQVKIWMVRHNEFTHEPMGHHLAHEVPDMDVDDEPDALVVLEHVFEQTNVGGDIVPAADWLGDFREKGWWSLSVGDVVELGDKPWICARFGWEPMDEMEWAHTDKVTGWSPKAAWDAEWALIGGSK